MLSHYMLRYMWRNNAPFAPCKDRKSHSRPQLRCPSDPSAVLGVACCVDARIMKYKTCVCMAAAADCTARIWLKPDGLRLTELQPLDLPPVAPKTPQRHCVRIAALHLCWVYIGNRHIIVFTGLQVGLCISHRRCVPLQVQVPHWHGSLVELEITKGALF